MSDENSTPPVEWNPLAELTPQRIPLKASGGRAAVLYRPWSGRESLAYEDAITERLLTVDQAGEETVRMGAMRLFAASLTIVGSEGFPKAADGRDYFTGTREQRESDLLAITDPATYSEIRDTALRVQPLPTAGGQESEDDEDGGEGSPSPTVSTSPTDTV